VRLVLATRNQGKVAELRRILAEVDLQAELVGLESFADVPDVAETGVSFAENSLLKARAVCAATGLTSVADDSGLCVDILNGMPGIFSARWAGVHGDDAANLALLLAQLNEVPASHRGAHFTCAAALATPEGEEAVVAGRLDGLLLREGRGTNGFGYDPIFVPHGSERTTAEMSAADKDAISHRGIAFRSLAARLVASLT